MLGFLNFNALAFGHMPPLTLARCLKYLVGSKWGIKSLDQSPQVQEHESNPNSKSYLPPCWCPEKLAMNSLLLVQPLEVHIDTFHQLTLPPSYGRIMLPRVGGKRFVRGGGGASSPFPRPPPSGLEGLEA